MSAFPCVNSHASASPRLHPFVLSVKSLVCRPEGTPCPAVLRMTRRDNQPAARVCQWIKLVNFDFQSQIQMVVTVLLKIIFKRKSSFGILKTRQHWRVFTSDNDLMHLSFFFPLPVFRSLYPLLRYHHGGFHLVLLHSNADCRTHCLAAGWQHWLGQCCAKARGEWQWNSDHSCTVHERRSCGGQHWLKKWQHFKTELFFLLPDFPQILIWRIVLLPRRMSCCAGFNALHRLLRPGLQSVKLYWFNLAENLALRRQSSIYVKSLESERLLFLNA